MNSSPRVALIQGNYSLCRQLLAGSAAHEPIDGVPPLGWAVQSGSQRLVKWLLSQCEVDVDARDSDGRTPLHRLLRCDDSDLADNDTLDMLELLLAHGANPALCDRCSESPLMAAHRYFPDMVALFEKHDRETTPPIRVIPPARAWQGKKVPRSRQERAGWTVAALVGCTFVFLVCNRQRFVLQPEQLPANKLAWSDQFKEAQAAWGRDDVLGASAYASAAIQIDPDADSAKGPVFALAARAFLKLGNLERAHAVLTEFDGLGIQEPALKTEMESYRSDFKVQAQAVAQSQLGEARHALKRRQPLEAEHDLEAARKLVEMANLSSSDCDDVARELASQNDAAREALALKHSEHAQQRADRIPDTPDWSRPTSRYRQGDVYDPHRRFQAQLDARLSHRIVPGYLPERF